MYGGDLEALNVFSEEVLRNVREINGWLYVRTVCGDLRCREGDYIVRDLNGQYHPYSSALFEENYELID